MEMQIYSLIYSIFSKPGRQYPQRISAASPSQHKHGTFLLPSGHEGTAAVRIKRMLTVTKYSQIELSTN